MKIIKKDTSWNQYDDVLMCENIHPLYTQKIINLYNSARYTYKKYYNVKFIAVEDNYKLHIKQVCF